MAGYGIVRARAFHAAGRLALVAAVALVGACSTLEDLDPRGGLIPHTDQPVPGGDQPYPNLASVPNGPPTTTPKATRIELQQKLAADTKATNDQSDSAAPPQVPAPPAALPKSFIAAQQPVKLPATAASIAADAGATTAASGGPQGSAPTDAPSPAAPSADAGQSRAAPAVGAAPGYSREIAEGAAEGRLAIVLFAEGSSEIDPAQLAKLRPVVRLLRRQGGAVQVVGYASRQAANDTAEGKIANFNLSLDRANAVARALMRLGAKPSEVIVSAEGERAPPLTGAGSSAAADQRADVFLAR